MDVEMKQRKRGRGKTQTHGDHSFCLLPFNFDPVLFSPSSSFKFCFHRQEKNTRNSASARFASSHQDLSSSSSHILLACLSHRSRVSFKKSNRKKRGFWKKHRFHPFSSWCCCFPSSLFSVFPFIASTSIPWFPFIPPHDFPVSIISSFLWLLQTVPDSPLSLSPLLFSVRFRRKRVIAVSVIVDVVVSEITSTTFDVSNN